MASNPYAPKVFDPAESTAAARRNVVASIFGRYGTGKTHLVLRCARPLFVVTLDLKDTLDQHLLATAEEFPGPVEYVKLPPIRYSLLTVEAAQRRVDAVWDLADKARRVAREADGGTFVIDGGKILKGYIEKAELGESATLGYRPDKGGRGILPIEYGRTNELLRQLIASFVGSPMDFAITFEGRRVYLDTRDEQGKPKSVRTERFNTTAPDNLGYVIKAEVETLMTLEDVVVENKVVGKRAVPKVRIGWNAYDPMLIERTMPAKTFAQLKALFLAKVPAEEVLDPFGTAVHEVATMEGD